MLRELTLPKCISAWGLTPPELDLPASATEDAAQQQQPALGSTSGAGVWKQARLPNGKMVSLPRVPPKYLKFLRVSGISCLQCDHMP